MDQCARCGHGLGIGIFCNNCGHAIARPVPAGDEWRSSTAERPATPANLPTTLPNDLPTGRPTYDAPVPSSLPEGPTAPPPAFGAPPKARFPLFADEIGTDTTVAVAAMSAPQDAQPPVWAPTPSAGEQRQSNHADTSHRKRRGTLPWLAGAAALVVVAGTGAVLLVGGDDTEPAGASDTPRPGDSSPSAPEDRASSEAPAPPPESSNPTGGPLDVASLATAAPPATAAPSRDVTGNAVRYDAFYMLDGQSDTAWRMPGDASGSDVVFSLGGPTEIDEVGLINGYAKTAPGYDGYTANRRILAVEWLFADGTVVSQSLTDGERGLQTVPVNGGNVTDIVTLHITQVSRPATGTAGRDFTAISDVALVGKPV